MKRCGVTRFMMRRQHINNHIYCYAETSVILHENLDVDIK